MIWLVLLYHLGYSLTYILHCLLRKVTISVTTLFLNPSLLVTRAIKVMASPASRLSTIPLTAFTICTLCSTLMSSMMTMARGLNFPCPRYAARQPPTLPPIARPMGPRTNPPIPATPPATRAPLPLSVTVTLRFLSSLSTLPEQLHDGMVGQHHPLQLTTLP